MTRRTSRPRKIATALSLLLLAAGPLAAQVQGAHNPVHNDLTEPVVDSLDASCESKDCLWLRLDGGYLDTVAGEAAEETLYWGDATLWSEANDGAGSGLDADLLDGLTSAQLLRSDANGALAGNLRLRDLLVEEGFSILGTDTQGRLILRAASVPNDGGRIDLYGPEHATSPGDIVFIADSQELARITSDGRVGIGTGSPAGALHVRDGPDAGLVFEHGSTANAARLRFVDDEASPVRAEMDAYQHRFLVEGTPALTVDENRRVGIGTSSPTDLLDVRGTGAPTLKVAETGSDVRAIVQAEGTDGGRAYYGTLTAHPVNIGTGGTGRVHVAADGNVGIGTIPERNLDIRSATPDAVLRLRNADSTGSYAALVLDGNQDLHIVNGEDGEIRFGHHADPNQMLLTQDGRLGIGSNQPRRALHVESVASQLTGLDAGGTLLLEDADTSANLLLGVRGATGGSNAIQSRTGTESAWPLALNPFGGNVGVGTTQPSSRLVVSSASPHDGLVVENLGSSATSVGTLLSGDALGSVSGRTFEGRIQASNVNDFLIGANGPVPLAFYNSNGRHLTIDGNGNVGIGAAAPSAKLTVHAATNGEYAGFVRNVAGEGHGLLVRGSSGGSSATLLRVEDNLQSPKLVVGGDGNVGIGTANPADKLTVSGSGTTRLSVHNTQRALGQFADVSFGTGSTDAERYLAHIRAAVRSNEPNPLRSSLSFFVNQGDSALEAVTIRETGHVGLGTSQPSETLHAYSPERAAVAQFTSGNATGGFLRFGAGTDTNKVGSTRGMVGYGSQIFGGEDEALFGLRSQGPLTFTTLGENRRMTIDTSGNVGIGTTAPTALLDVAGAARAEVLSLTGSGPLGSCSSPQRGTLRPVFGGSGEADVLHMCLKAADGSFAWKPIVTG